MKVSLKYFLKKYDLVLPLVWINPAVFGYNLIHKLILNFFNLSLDNPAVPLYNEYYNNYIASYLMNSHVTKSNRERSVLFVMCEFFYSILK